MALSRGRWILVSTGLAFLLLAGAGGCGKGGGQTEVSGVVKFNGAPVPGGSITFVSQADPKQRGKAIINGQGQYTIVQPPEGEVKVGVEVSQSSDPAQQQSQMNLPPKYLNPATSGLTYTVNKGKQTKNFDLTP